ncbi:MAG: nucleotide exchange factor GrpE [Candidatus Vogelbacteria bacterium]|nr:nucleotide exchange factor GrpE [Candidatus Vogelbacteria bacterium]
MNQDDLNQSEDIVVDEEAEHSPVDQLKKLRDRLKICESERGQYLDGWQRAKADLVNEKRLFDNDRKALLDHSLEFILGRFFILADHFESAISNRKVWESAPPNWRQGIEGIYKELDSIFKEYGVELITPAVGENFDPARDHSIGTVKSENEDQDGKIAQVIQKGYKRGDKMLRPTQVKVFNN